MTLFPSTVRNDLKCGKGAISKGEKCTKGPATQAKAATTEGLERGTTKELVSHRNQLYTELVRKYGKPINNPDDLKDFDRWAAKQPLQQEINKVNSLIWKRRERNSKIATAIGGLGALAAISGIGIAGVRAFGGGRRGDCSDGTSGLTPSSLRLDLKCGKGAISKGEKCTKGPATQAKARSSDNNTIRNVAVGLGTAAVIGGALYGRHKYKKALAAQSAPRSNNANPEVGISRGRAAFKEARGVSTGMSVAGAGLVVAGGGLIANEAAKDPKKRDARAIAIGTAATYFGFGALASGRAMRTQLAAEQANWETKAGEYKTQWYEARQRAQERAKQNAQSGSQGTRNVGSNKAVPEPYKDLGMSETASDAELKSRWLQLMRENHPDAGGDPRKAQRINAAYQEILRRRGRLDSIWADGFAIDWEAIRL